MTTKTDTEPPKDEGIASSYCSCGADVELLYLIARIREAAGDPNGKLMQDELVDRIRNLRTKTIRECADLIVSQLPGTKYSWMPNSAFGNIAKEMSQKIKALDR